MTTTATVRRSTLALAALTIWATAFANPLVAIEASTMPYHDAKDDTQPITEAGVDLTCEGTLQLVFAPKGRGNLGNAIVPGYGVDLVPKNALGDVQRAQMVTWNGTVAHVPEGMKLIVKDVSRNELRDRTAAQLAATGCTIVEHYAGSNVIFFGHGGRTYRATFSTVTEGAQLYIGR